MLIRNKAILIFSLLIFTFALNAQITNYQTYTNSKTLSHFADNYNNNIIRYNYEKIADSTLHIKKKRLYNHIANRNLFVIEQGDYKVYIDPYIDLYYGKEGSRVIQNNSRGITLKGKIGKKLSFISEFYDTQGKYPYSIQQQAYKTQSLPGYSAFKEFKDSAFDFGNTSTLIKFEASKNFNICLGNDKLFIGDGYKSLFLTYNSPNYQFLNYNFRFKNFSYSVINTIMISSFPNHPFESRYFNKYVNYYIASYKLNKLNISFIESVIYQTKDSLNSRYEAKAINPIILSNTLLNTSNNNDNILNGLNISFQATDKHLFYMQTNLGILNNSKGKAFQFGYKQTEYFKIYIYLLRLI